MKIVVLIAGGRTGSDFFQSLLDGHPEISQLPGVFLFDDFWTKIKNENKPETIVKTFIDDYQHFFDSRKNLIERHNMLGDKKNEFFLVDKNLYTKYFLDLMKNNEINKKNLILNLNLAYSKASGNSISKKKIILLHLHHVSRMKVLNSLNFEIIYMIRDPLAAYTSAIKHWYNYRNKEHITPQIYYFHIERFFNGLKDSLNYKKKIYVIPLEKLHIENKIVMNNLCTIFNISYDDTMTKSTYHGKSWWGDQLSGKDLNGVNPNFKNIIDENLFFKKDVECLETYLKFFLLKYDYPFRSKGLKYQFLKYLPFKVELKIWKNALSSLEIRKIMSIFKYWYKRVCLMNNMIHDNVDFPNPVGKNYK